MVRMMPNLGPGPHRIRGSAIRIRNVNDSAFKQDSARYQVSGHGRFQRSLGASFMLGQKRKACLDPNKNPPSRSSEDVTVSASQSRAADLDQRIEHRLQIEGRTADNFEHVGSGRLLLQRFAQLI